MAAQMAEAAKVRLVACKENPAVLGKEVRQGLLEKQPVTYMPGVVAAVQNLSLPPEMEVPGAVALEEE